MQLWPVGQMCVFAPNCWFCSLQMRSRSLIKAACPHLGQCVVQKLSALKTQATSPYKNWVSCALFGRTVLSLSAKQWRIKRCRKPERNTRNSLNPTFHPLSVLFYPDLVHPKPKGSDMFHCQNVPKSRINCNLQQAGRQKCSQNILCTQYFSCSSRCRHVWFCVLCPSHSLRCKGATGGSFSFLRETRANKLPRIPTGLKHHFLWFATFYDKLKSLACLFESITAALCIGALPSGCQTFRTSDVLLCYWLVNCVVVKAVVLARFFPYLLLFFIIPFLCSDPSTCDERSTEQEASLWVYVWKAAL